MAATPLTDAAFAIKGRGSIGDIAVRIVDIALTVGYTVNGYAISSKQLGLGGTGVILMVLVPGGTAGYFFEWLPATSKLKVRDASGGAAAVTPEIADATALTGLVARALVFGQGQG